MRVAQDSFQIICSNHLLLAIGLIIFIRPIAVAQNATIPVIFPGDPDVSMIRVGDS
jgi:hypothetical protein